MNWKELENLFHKNRENKKIILQTGENGFEMLNKIFRKHVEKNSIQEQAEAIKESVTKEKK